MATFNQFLHAGERNNNKVIIENTGSAYNRKTRKRVNGGYLLVCKCGYGFIVKTYYDAKGNNPSGYKPLCPCCEEKLKGR